MFFRASYFIAASQISPMHVSFFFLHRYKYEENSSSFPNKREDRWMLQSRYFPTSRSKSTLATTVTIKISELAGNKVEFLVANSRNEGDGTTSDSQKCIRSFMYG